MKTITLLPHTADTRIHVAADTLPELFEGCLVAMTNILKEGFCENPNAATVSQSISLSSRDRTSLLIDFLSEVLTLSYTGQALFCTMQVIMLTDNNLNATVMGSPADTFDEDIKAVTYHEADVKQDDAGRWETIVIFDI
jgi:SHS2 domain-containing protein